MRTIGRSPTRFVSAATVGMSLVLGACLLAAGASSAETATGVASATCLECHGDRGASLAGTPHQIVDAEAHPDQARISCTDCHHGPAKHWEDDPEAFPMSNPATAAAATTAKLCASCHVNPHQQNMMTSDPHVVADVSCTSCHEIHAGPRLHQLKQPEPELCYTCHQQVQGQFAQSSRHPVSDGVMVCSDCHLKQADGREVMSYAGTNALCFQCHRQFQGPFPYEHQATLDFSTEDGGCLNCHDPHGSSLPRLLKQSYDPPQAALCKQCHTVPKHEYNQEHGARWAGMACNECHVDIHGSYENRLFLTPALRAQGCTACHHF